MKVEFHDKVTFRCLDCGEYFSVGEKIYQKIENVTDNNRNVKNALCVNTGCFMSFDKESPVRYEPYVTIMIGKRED